MTEEIAALTASQNKLKTAKESVEKAKASLAEENQNLRKQLAEEAEQIGQLETLQQELQGNMQKVSLQQNSYSAVFVYCLVQISYIAPAEDRALSGMNGVLDRKRLRPRAYDLKLRKCLCAR